MVDGIRTHYLEAGDGERTVVLLHAGGYGDNAALDWSSNFEALAARYRVVAPDWLGFGGTDKIRDFVDGTGRMLRHMTRFLEIMCIEDAHFGGQSMGGTYLLKMAAQSPCPWPVRSVFVASGGGFVPANEARTVVQSYDQTLEAMRAVYEVTTFGQRWTEDEQFIKQHYEASLEPGAWEFASAARLRAPAAAPGRGEFGVQDTIAYEQIAVPVLYTAGAQDRMREPGYVDSVVARTPHGRAVTFDECGHFPSFEQADRWNDLVLGFLDEVDTAG